MEVTLSNWPEHSAGRTSGCLSRVFMAHCFYDGYCHCVALASNMDSAKHTYTFGRNRRAQPISSLAIFWLIFPSPFTLNVSLHQLPFHFRTRLPKPEVGDPQFAMISGKVPFRAAECAAECAADGG